MDKYLFHFCNYKFSDLKQNSQKNKNLNKQYDNKNENEKDLQYYQQEQENLVKQMHLDILKEEKERLKNAHKQQIQLEKILQPAPLEIKFEEKSELLADDYTNSPSVFKFNQQSKNNQGIQSFQNKDGLTLNTDSELQLKDNELAMQILKEGKINLQDKRINVQNINISDMDVFGNQKENNIQQIDLGNIVSNKKDSLLLEDVDVYNIPADKDILLSKKEKKMQAIGIKVKKNQDLDDNDNNINETQQQKQSFDGQMVISKNLFEEKNLKEYADENLFKIEQDLLYYDWNQFYKTVAKLLPVWILFYFFAETTMEYFATRHDIYLMQEQELEIYEKLKKQYTKQILLEDSRFDRSKLFGELYQ
ncbi:hypothetical protein PPERSA_08169 [Pseudocohnilembus persalinus]|uniref:Uncharacterized protein n=1 Tax=Pseudocohnilembus persalinus TaxID=266149 RepID=A0A0V0R366_PSEPJ|nr:hypothetical protein PPERSA_08169 [Pseudocohnilembus persalinus]|eukprot:KRX08966.1 hypothetical protein PPERSA_08169 [Pseudocohnilembus persalinus]